MTDTNDKISASAKTTEISGGALEKQPNLTTKYCRDDFTGEFTYPAPLYAALLSITQHRLDGHELDKRRPSVLLRFPGNDQFMLRIEPKLGSSATGWQIDRIEAKVLGRDGKSEITATLHRDGAYRLRSWYKDANRSHAAIAVLDDTLARITNDPRKAMAQSADNCCVCGKSLSDPQSRQEGIGPECRKTAFVFIRDLMDALEVENEL